MTVIVAGQDLLNPLGSSLSDRVATALQSQGARLIVRRFTETDRNVTGPTTVLYRATVIAETLIERADANEVAAVIVFAFYLATGYQPTEWGVSNVAAPGTTNPLPDTPDQMPRIPVLSELLDALRTTVAAAPWLVIALVVVVIIAFFMFSQRISAIGSVKAR